MKSQEIALIVAVITVVIVVILYIIANFQLNARIYVKSKVDGRNYLVKNDADSQDVADTLAMLCMKSEKLIKFVGESPKPSKFTKNISNLTKRYTTLSENIDLTSTSYTINKGEEVAMCITTRNKEETIYDTNTLMFVCIHELAHIGCETVGHGQEFQDFFRFLLKEAVVCGVYTYKNYKVSPQEYCGMTITNNPLNS